MLSKVVYKYKSGYCSSIYIDETFLNIATCIAQQRRLSVRTDFRLAAPRDDRIWDHFSQAQHGFCNENFIFLSVFNKFGVQIIEGIYILQPNQNVNSKNSSALLNFHC